MANIFEQPQLHLAKPQKDYYSVLSGVKSFQSKIYLNNICGISFRVYEYENGERNELYDELEETQLIQALDYDVEWFQIAKSNEVKGDDIPVAYKDITCNSLEDELITKTVYNLNGVFSLYNTTDTTKSIMHIVTNEISWDIGYITPQLTSLFRTLSIDSGRIYSLLTSDLSKSFDCIFKFNREYKTISAYTLDEIGGLTDIVISEQNLLKSWEKNSSKDKIVTKMRCIGGTNTSGVQFDIRKVNFGSDTITNYSYFKSRMSTELQTVLSSWESAIETNTVAYNTNINLLKTYNTELTTLTTELKEIEAQISAQEEVMNASLKSHNGYPPVSSDADYMGYQNARNQLVTLSTQKANKEAEINSKNSQIATVNTTLDTISANVSKSKFFTSDLLNELDCFTYVGDDYIDDTFLATSETTSTQEIEMALQLKANAEKELHIACRPQPEFTATLKNLWSLNDEKDCVISYDAWRQKFKVGNMVTILLNDDSWTTVRIIGIELDYDNPEDAEITFSSRTRLDNSTYNLGEIQAQASRAYSAISMNKYSWNKAATQTSANQEFRDGTFTATLNKMQSDPLGKVEFGDFGIKCRTWVESEKKYGLNQMWLNPYRMLFTSDGWQTANSAFGLLQFPDGTQGMGISTKYLIGEILIGNNLYMQNSNNTMQFNENGLSITNGTNTIAMNPNVPNLFTISKGATQQFYVDTSGNLVLTGTINATSGTLGSLTVNGTLSGGTISGATVSGGVVTGAVITASNSVFTSSTLTNCTVTGTLSANDADITVTSILTGHSLFLGDGKITTDGAIGIYNNDIICRDLFINNTDTTGLTKTATATGTNIKSYISTSISDSLGSYMHILDQSTEGGNAVTNISYSGGTLKYAKGLTFQIATSSDQRLKYDISPIQNIEKIYPKFKPMQYRFKTSDTDDKLYYGVMAQDLISIFNENNIDWKDCNIIEEYECRNFSDENLYVDNGKAYRVNYNNLHAYHIAFGQFVYSELTERIVELEKRIAELVK